MAIKDWKRQDADDEIHFDRKGYQAKRLIILSKTIHNSINFPRIFINAPKNHKYCITGTFSFAPFDTFQTKSQALAYAKEYMRSH